jgi:hypothetical protein
MVKALLSKHLFPGDTDPAANSWVTDTALDLIAGYNPRFVWLTYARQFYSCRYTEMSQGERAALFSSAAGEINRFIDTSGFTPVIAGTGSLAPLTKIADVSALDGLALTTHWSARYAGLHNPSAADLRALGAMRDIARIAPREELMALFPESPCDPARLPDYLLAAADGCAFKASGGFQRKVLEVNTASYDIPVSNYTGGAESITQIRALVEESLKHNKTALIIAEGFGSEEFNWPHTSASNGRGWYFYEPGDAQYLAVSAGMHRPFDYPMGYKYFDDDVNGKEYPLSGYFTSVPGGTIGGDLACRSIAVGNRSMYMHMIPGADISVECFARNLYNQGTLAVIHRENNL